MPENISSPLSGWMGGKSILSRRIAGMLPEHKCYCEPFAGAAWVMFRKQESRVEVLNDINREIVTFTGWCGIIWKNLSAISNGFLFPVMSLSASKARCARLTLTDIQRAARFYYLQQMCFGGRMDGNPSFGYAAVRGPKLNLLRIEEQLSAAHLRLARVYVECLPYHEVIKSDTTRRPRFYVDPPYWDCENYYGKGLFCREDFTVLAELLGKIEGKFILSLNDKPEVRELFRHSSWRK